MLLFYQSVIKVQKSGCHLPVTPTKTAKTYPKAACAAANLAIGTRNGEQET